jgi:hypothetical protein
MIKPMKCRVMMKMQMTMVKNFSVYLLADMATTEDDMMPDDVHGNETDEQGHD